MMIHLLHAAFVYQAPDGEVEALRDVSLDVEEGEFCSIVGPSGCGKSTLLSVLAGLETLTGGEVTVDGEPLRGPSPKVGFMPQQDQLFPWRSIWDNVTLALAVRGENTPENQARVRSLLERYGLWAFRDKRPGQLSGGMRQRCALIRTLAADPRILLLDEPFSALDYQTRLSVSADIYRIIRQEGKTALLADPQVQSSASGGGVFAGGGSGVHPVPELRLGHDLWRRRESRVLSHPAGGPQRAVCHYRRAGRAGGVASAAFRRSAGRGPAAGAVERK